MYNATVRWSAVAVTALTIALSGWHCTGDRVNEANSPPITRLSNVPPPDSFIVTKNPRLTLYWVGDDQDGFVVAFRYRWSFRLNSGSPFQQKPYSMVLNIIVSNFALMTDATPENVPNVYHYFATLPPEGLFPDSANALDAGNILTIAGAHVWASNPRTVRFPVHTSPNSGTFIFDSQDSLNPHTFEVSAIDNQAAIGTPATVSFGTPRVPPPQTQITLSPGDTVLVINKKTDTFPGVQFGFQGFDPNSRTIEYSWVVDRDQWPHDSIPWSPFSQSTTAFVTAADFRDPYATRHTFYVRGRNEFGSIDTLGYYVHTTFDGNNNPIGFDTIWANVSFNTLYPLFLRPGAEHRILILNDCFNYGSTGTIVRPTIPMIDAYYSSMFDSLGKAGAYDVFDVTDVNNTGTHIFPGRGLIGQYSLVVVSQDVLNDVDHTVGFAHGLNIARQKILTDYCYVGGKLILTGWALPFALNCGQDFINRIGHLQVLGTDLTRGNFLGTRGDKGYPDMGVDPTRLDSAWGAGLTFMWPGRPTGFGEIIERYDAADNNIIFENGTIGVRYIGITYSCIYFGCPLYYMVPSGSIQAMRTALVDLQELNP
jgi:hypothetical protein